MEKVLASELVEDFKFYPRSAVDSTHVTDIAEAFRAGQELPPVVACRKTKRLVDGFHRTRAIKRVFGDEAEISVEWRDYPTEQALYLDALRMNAHNAKKISGNDRTHAIIVGLDLNLKPAAIAEAFGVTVERVELIVAIKTGHMKRTTAKGKQITQRLSLKNSVRHLQGTNPELTPEQAKVIESSPGQSQGLLIRQLADLIEAELIDWSNETAVAQLDRLYQLLKERMKKSA